MKGFHGNLDITTNKGWLRNCLKCEFQNGAFEVKNTFKIYGNQDCRSYLPQTFIADSFNKDTSIYIIQGTDDMPIINIEVP
jgi:hypothetical protein